MVMSGSDADALDALAHQMGGKSSKIQGVSKRLGREIHGSPWHGRNADRFRRDWDGEYRRSLAEAATFLQQAGEGLHRNAREQRGASGIAQPRSAWQGFQDAFGTVVKLWGGNQFEIQALKDIGSWASSFRGLEWRTTQLHVNKAFQKALSAGIPPVRTWMESIRKTPAKFLALPRFSKFLGVLGVITLGFDVKDLIWDQEYSGAFNYLESFSDSLRVAAGVVSLVALFTPLAPIVMASAFVAIGASLIIDVGMNHWDKRGGREKWKSTQPHVNKAFNNAFNKALSGLKGAPVSTAMKSTWNTPSPAGRMQFSPSLPGSLMRDAGC
jgi:uncharacterized protein YukE